MNIFKETGGHGKEVVILHGWGGFNHCYMQPIVDQLIDRCKVTNFDLPGQGQSDWHAEINSMNDIADQLLSFLPKQATYIGWSFGGMVAMSIAARYPERVNQFIGITTTPKFVASDKWPGIPQPGFQAAFIPGIKSKGWKTFMQEWIGFEFADFDPKPTTYYDLIKLIDKDSAKINLDVLFKGVEIVDSTDMRKLFSSISCPIDLILGEQDDSIPKESFQKFKELNSQVSIHTISNAKHMPFWTHPLQFAKILNHIL